MAPGTQPANVRSVKKVKRWIVNNGIAKLNVAGPRESQQPGIYETAAIFLRKVTQ
ncbi:MAG: hypothetical protein NTV22_04020 [bacterium]|nr:hypothetical protein [bacterium]